MNIIPVHKGTYMVKPGCTQQLMGGIHNQRRTISSVRLELQDSQLEGRSQPVKSIAVGRSLQTVQDPKSSIYHHIPPDSPLSKSPDQN